MTAEEFLQTADDPPCEYVDGQLIPREGGDNLHSLFTMLLLVNLSRGSANLDLSVRPSLLIQCSPTRFRIPDVSVFEGALREDIPSRAPLVTFEILSNEDPFCLTRAKVRDHVAGGAQKALMIAPSLRDVLVYDTAGLRSLEGRRILRLETKKGVLEIDFDALFAEMDRDLSPE